MTKPLRCPFCHADGCDVDGSRRALWVFCGTCGAEGPFAQSKRDAIAKWNAAPREGDGK